MLFFRYASGQTYRVTHRIIMQPYQGEVMIGNIIITKSNSSNNKRAICTSLISISIFIQINFVQRTANRLLLIQRHIATCSCNRIPRPIPKCITRFQIQ